MQINSINNGPLNVGGVNKRGKEVKGDEKITDSLSISTEARALSSSTVKMNKLAIIQQRINENYYDNDLIIRKIVDRIAKDL